MNRIRIAVVGLGKIARDQHLPTIATIPELELVATVSRSGGLDKVSNFARMEQLLGSGLSLDAVALCTPPQIRRDQALQALAAGKHVLLEKPPGSTVGELAPLIGQARRSRASLFAAWHSRFAPAVEPARAWLAERQVLSVAIEWKEDVRVWHPGQTWIWEPGGLGVFDPGINALSILTSILPQALFVTDAMLTFPSNRAAPIAADLAFSDSGGLSVRAALDFRQTGPQVWEIRIETDDGPLVLSAGGARLTHAGRTLIDEVPAEYPELYRYFVRLIEAGTSDVDVVPLQHVADAFLLGRRALTEAFED